MRTWIPALLALGLLAILTAGAAADATTSDKTSPPLTADAVLAALHSSIEWYQSARVTMRDVNRTGALFTVEDQETARHTLERAFAVAHARAALLKQTSAGSDKPPAQQRLADARAGLEVAIGAEEQWVKRAPASERAAARRRLELERARLDIMKQLQGFNTSLTGGAPTDLSQQIDALEQSIPELRASATTAEPPATDSGARTFGLVSRLFRVRQSRASVDQLAAATDTLARTVTADTKTVGEELRGLGVQLSSMAENPDSATPAADAERDFQGGLARAKALAAVMVPLREQTSLLRRYGQDLKRWRDALDTETAEVVKSLALDLLRLALVIALVLIGAGVWRFLTLRYIADASRRRVLLAVRTVVVTIAVGLVIVFHFATELTALVTALGFAAAGIAFALQNVILALAGYFAMLSPHGIRVGDRVSLQGPFGYVSGEVVDIGFVRIRLQELSGDPPRPTGRIVVFPNSVVFTGTFFKQAAGEEAEPLRRSA